MKKIVLASVAFLSLSAFADDGAFSSVTVGAVAGTPGAGVQISTPLMSMLSARAVATGYSLNRSYNVNSISYSGTLALQNFGLLADFNPFITKLFRISAGAYYNANKATISANSSATYTLNGTTYSAAQVGTMNASVKYNSLSPYLGLGSDIFFTNSLSLSIDLGAMYTGKPTSSLTIQNPYGYISQSNISSTQSQFTSTVNKVTWFPVAQIGLNYKF